MKKLSKEKRDHLILVAISTCVAVVALWYLVISTQQKAIQDIAKNTLEEQGKVANAQRLVSSTSEIQKSLETSQQELKTIENGLASGDMYSWIILTINRFRADRKV